MLASPALPRIRPHGSVSGTVEREVLVERLLLPRAHRAGASAVELEIGLERVAAEDHAGGTRCVGLFTFSISAGTTFAAPIVGHSGT